MNDLYSQSYSYSNLFLAYQKARRHKTLRSEVIEFEQDLGNNLSKLQLELIFHTYKPQPLTTFVIRDPKTRKISKSHFRDRIVHHALCNIIEPFFEKSFIYDSYANRKRKGTLKAIRRFEYFSNKISKNNTEIAFALKCDIKHYFDNVNHNILLTIIQRKIKDAKIIWLIKIILSNYGNNTGMPLGNLTSQFFANVYLNELDYFVKHKLKAKYYIRYVDDFVIIRDSFKIINEWKERIDRFLNENLMLELHPDKSKIIPLNRGIDFLGFKIFLHYRLLKRRNRRKFQRKLRENITLFETKQINYDKLYDFMEGWIAYAKHANTYKLRQKILTEFETKFSGEISSKEINKRLVHGTTKDPFCC
ncbi:MAG: reverse transcriptase domain-containing protein [Nanoarchaeota archaeon]